ncbi:MAG: STAS domain-containing protein [Myxococcales bacterium]
MSGIAEDPVSARSIQPPARPALGCEWRRLEGVFDAGVALELGASLTAERPAGALHLDFSRAERIEDRGLAAFAALLTAASIEGRVFFHGLSRHQIRLLAYFGVDGERGGASFLQ